MFSIARAVAFARAFSYAGLMYRWSTLGYVLLAASFAPESICPAGLRLVLRGGSLLALAVHFLGFCLPAQPPSPKTKMGAEVANGATEPTACLCLTLGSDGGDDDELVGLMQMKATRTGSFMRFESAAHAKRAYVKLARTSKTLRYITEAEYAAA